MKKSLRNLFFGTSVLLSVSLISQPTLTATGINPVVGDIFISNGANTLVNPGSAGTNQTWNLTPFTTAFTTTTTCVSPSSTAHGSSFPNANVAGSAVTGTNTAVSYMKTSSTAFQNHGNVINSGTITIVMPYSNPEDFLHFPFTYNNSYTDTWATTYAIVSGTFTNTTYRTGTDSIKADGYGTLTTPAGTFGNVMRVHFVQNYKDSTVTSGFPVASLSSYRNDEYMWYLNNNHAAIASASTLYTTTSYTNSVTYSGNYLSGVVAGVDQSSNTQNSFKLFPNPAANTINLHIALAENQKIDIKLYNSLGQIGAAISAEGIQGSNDYKLTLADLPNGIYFAQISLDGTLSSTRRFVISK